MKPSAREMNDWSRLPVGETIPYSTEERVFGRSIGEKSSCPLGDLLGI